MSEAPSRSQPRASASVQFSILRNLSQAKGVKGSKAMARSAQSCRQTLRMVPVRARSVLATFHGSLSEMYLLPMRAICMASLRASRKRNPSMFFSRLSFRGAIESRVSRSMSSSSPAAGTRPSKYLWVSTTARFTKLPKIATSSELLRVWNSFQLKSLSLVSGALAVST